MDMRKLVEAVRAHGGLENAEIIDAGNHGADAGWGGFTYTSDCVEFYAANEEAIWELLRESADDMGVKPLELVASFRRADMADDPSGFKNLLAWFALEEAGRWLESQAEREGEEEDGEATESD